MSTVAQTSLRYVVGHARPLIVRFGALGDMVILTAFIRALHDRFDTDVDVVCGSSVAPLLVGQPGIGTVYPLYTRQLPHTVNPQQWILVERLRARGAGPVWICQTDDVSHALIERAGYDRRWCVSLRDFSVRPEEHAIDQLLRMADATPSMMTDMRGRSTSAGIVPTLVVPADVRAEMHSWLEERGLHDRSLILVQAGNKRTMRLGSRRRASNKKYWPEEHWAAVIDGIDHRLSGAAILLLGVSLESLLNRAILRFARTTSAIDVAGEVPLGLLPALCERAHSMISVDTGPAHVAAAVSCPLVVMFGTKPPTFYAPRAASSAVEVLVGSRTAAVPLLTITPDSVLAAWERLCARAPHTGSLRHRMT